jgi:hypothetical protein
MEVKIIWIRVFHIQQGWYGHQLHAETISVWIVCLQLEKFSSEPGAPKRHFEKLYFKNCTFLIEKNPKNNWNDQMCILTVWFRMIPWLLSNSSKPWSYGMCSVCRDPKTQKWRRWRALRGWPFGGKNDQNKVSHVQQGRYGLQLHVETVSVWIVCVDLELMSSKKVLGPRQ